MNPYTTFYNMGVSCEPLPDSLAWRLCFVREARYHTIVWFVLPAKNCYNSTKTEVCSKRWSTLLVTFVYFCLCLLNLVDNFILEHQGKLWWWSWWFAISSCWQTYPNPLQDHPAYSTVKYGSSCLYICLIASSSFDRFLCMWCCCAIC